MGSRKSLVRQVQERLSSMTAFGRSKHADKQENRQQGLGCVPDRDKLYSFSATKNYLAAAVRFARWTQAAHHCRNIDEAQQYAGEYLQMREAENYSAWTVRLDAAALAKLYQCRTTELDAPLPVRHRSDVTEHRNPETILGHYSEAKNADLAALCRSCGLRRSEAAALRADDVTRRLDGTVLVRVRSGKGGKARTVTALNDTPARLAEKAAAEGRARVIEHIPSRAPIHAYRAEFAQALYDREARDASALSVKEQYRCRGERRGMVYDRQAMAVVSRQLGHGQNDDAESKRLDVVTSYIR